MFVSDNVCYTGCGFTNYPKVVLKATDGKKFLNNLHKLFLMSKSRL